MKFGFRFFVVALLAAIAFDAAAQAVPPTLTKAFVPTSITAGGVAELVFTITNPANNPPQTFSFTDTLPAGLVVAPSGVTFTCASVTGSAVAGTNLITVTTATVGGGAATPTSCTFTVDVTNVTGQTGTCPVANFTNGPTNISATTNITNGVQAVCLTVNPATTLPPTLTKSFNPTSFAAGGTTTLTFTITNPAGNAAQTFSFTDTLPAGLQIAANPLVTGTGCTPAGTAPAGGSAIVVTGVQVGAGTVTPTVCTLTVAITNVTGQTGTCPSANFTNAAANISATTNITNGVQSSCVAVTGGAVTPSLNKAFNPTTIADGGTSVLTFTLTNPTGNGAVSNVTFTDTLPTNLRVANTTVGGTCANAAAATTLTTGGTSVAVANLQVPAGASTCTVTVNVTNAAGQSGTCPAANFTNAAANITSSANVTNAVTSSCLAVTAVTAQVPTLTKALNAATITAGGTSTLTFTITNPATSNPLQTFSFTDTLPTGLQLAAAPALVNGCTGGTVTANAGGASVIVAGSAVGASTATPTTCTISVNVTNVAGQSNASCATNPVAFTNAAANISGNVNITSAALTPSCLVVTPQTNTFTISKVANASAVATNSPLSYTITVTNNGPGAANGALLTDPAIAGFSATGITCTNATNGAVCPVVGNVTIGNLQGAGIALPTFPGSSTITFALSGTFTGTGSTVNTATITYAPGVVPPVTASSSATVNVLVPSAAIPTLAEQALLALAALLAMFGAFYLRRVRNQQ